MDKDTQLQILQGKWKSNELEMEIIADIFTDTTGYTGPLIWRKDLNHWVVGGFTPLFLILNDESILTLQKQKNGPFQEVSMVFHRLI